MLDENVGNVPKAKSGGAKGGKKTIEQQYQKKTQLEHILLRPDTYVGSVDPHTQAMWVLDTATKQVVSKTITFTPGMYKIFDEIIVNAADNKQRDSTMNKIMVDIDADEGFIKVWNNGNGIPVVMHEEEKVYVPELIFGNLLTGSNFDDNEAKTTGGRNGYGAKLANIFSKKFIVETFDSSRSLLYKQEFSDNMNIKGEPKITKKSSGTDFTCITFFPDFARFKMEGFDEDTVSLLSKRVYDISGTNTAAGAKLTVHLNGAKIDARNFEKYIGLYQGLEAPCAFERITDRWEIGVGVSDGTFQQVSFVNSISTTKGGTHVNYITDQIAQRLMAPVKKKNKGAEVKAHQIKAHLAVYVNALIVNPAFDSQTKENLTTKATQFGSKCEIPDKFMKQIEKSGIIDNILSWAKFKQTAELKKKSGAKRSKLLGISKLDDANMAGTAKSSECTLILTEGDSAKALAISGLGVVGRDYYGVFPLKGKLLNVREAAHAQIMKNEEVQNIAKILGLTFGRKYEDTSSLRYGHLMIMTDQDHDGSHIKGLLINFLHHFWPSLLKIEGFLQQFITPIVKCTKGHMEETFFTIPEYDQWKAANDDGKGWRIKYYKGLGTSTAAEAKEYFSHLNTHEINFAWDDKADDVIDMAFAKKRVDDRKLWLLGMEPGTHIDYDVEEVTYDQFVNKELILFSHADNERSIPHFMDGLKPSQRKVLYACFKRNLRQEIKVAQLAGYVSEHSAYHHGEASLTQTIIGMAQNFIGSNNINLLSPCGQFGTRLMGGKDAASPRYVFTKLENIARCIFHPDDDPLLNYLDDDGQSIEPDCYVPVIPMLLVNGSDGIGTGWSSTVPCFSPREIIANLRRMIKGQATEPLLPWYRGFGGEIEVKAGSTNQYSVKGRIEPRNDATVLISELPVGKWTQDYKQMLESWIIGAAPAACADGKAGDAPFIKDFKENHTDTTVKFTISMSQEKFAEIYHSPGGLHKKFKLDGSLATSNMNLFDRNQMIRKFASPEDIMASFFDVRLDYYEKRKIHLLGKLTEEWEKLDNKVRFILAVIDGKLKVSNRKKNDILADLNKQGFKAFTATSSKKKAGAASKDGGDDDDNDDDDDASAPASALEKGYDYLLSMKIWSLTMERVNALKSQSADKRAVLDELSGKSPEDLYVEDLDALELALDDMEAEMADAAKEETRARNKATSARNNKNSKKAGGRAATKRVAAAGGGSDDDDYDSFDDFVEDDSDDDYGGKKKAKKAPAKKTAAAAKNANAAANEPFVPPPVPKGMVIKEPKAPRAPKAASAAASSSVLSSLPAAASKSTAAMAKLKEQEKRAAAADDSDDEVQTMSLFERLKLNNAGSSALSTLGAVSAGGAGSGLSASATALASKKKAASSAPLAKVKAPVAKRAAATKKKTAIDLLSDDEDEDEDDESAMDFSDEDEDDFEEDSDVTPVKKKPAAKAPVAKKTAGVKRAVKGKAAAVEEAFSPGVPTPKPVKKAKKSSPPAAKKAAPKAKAPAAKKAAAAPKKKATTVSDSEDDNEDDEDDEVVPSRGKSSRARATTSKNYADYYQDDEDEDEDDFGAEESEEEDDFSD
jgi:DNA topoisomerase-2